MKQFLAFTLAFLVMMSLTACGGTYNVDFETTDSDVSLNTISSTYSDDGDETSTTDRVSQNKTTTKSKNSTTRKKTTSITTKNTTTTTSVTYKTTKSTTTTKATTKPNSTTKTPVDITDVTPVNWDDAAVYIDGEKVPANCTVNQLLEILGRGEFIRADQILQPNEIIYTSIGLEEDADICVNILNDTNKPQRALDCTIIEMAIDDDIEEASLDITFPFGLHIGDEMSAEILRAMFQKYQNHYTKTVSNGVVSEQYCFRKNEQGEPAIWVTISYGKIIRLFWAI